MAPEVIQESRYDGKVACYSLCSVYLSMELFILAAFMDVAISLYHLAHKFMIEFFAE
jgi:hypothetical protein